MLFKTFTTTGIMKSPSLKLFDRLPKGILQVEIVSKADRNCSDSESVSGHSYFTVESVVEIVGDIGVYVFEIVYFGLENLT